MCAEQTELVGHFQELHVEMKENVSHQKAVFIWDEVVPALQAGTVASG